MAAIPPRPQVASTGCGRTFTGRRKVRLGDVTPGARLRLDALTRYTQDVSDDDTNDAGLAAEPAWVVRRTEVDVVGPASLGETLTFTTFCSGLGRRWAERRLRVRGDEGAVYEVATLWICVDPASGRPARLTDQFLAIYGPAAAGREVTARLSLPRPAADAVVRRWPLRVVDFDTLGHVNNAAYWAVVEEAMVEIEPEPPFRAVIEYGAGVPAADEVTVARSAVDGVPHLWWLGAGGTMAAVAAIGSLPADLYSDGS
ncbi:MAG: acyl-[acyl-carrier-protein] thioesterase [Acidimicrobiales bacterium]